MEEIILDSPDLKISQETGDDQPMLHLQITIHLHPEWLEMISAGARSASVSLEKYVTECAKDGLARGYR